eukprot:g20643.t1
MRQKGAEFLKLHPEYAQLLPDSFSVFSLLMWLLALSFLFGHIFLALRSRLRCNPEVLFFPDSSGVHVRHICHMLRSARRRMWIAMFTLTDDVLSQEILNAWARNVDVKVILDDEQCERMKASWLEDHPDVVRLLAPCEDQLQQLLELCEGIEGAGFSLPEALEGKNCCHSLRCLIANMQVWGAVGNPRAEGSDFALLTLGQE